MMWTEKIQRAGVKIKLTQMPGKEKHGRIKKRNTEYAGRYENNG